MRVGFAGAGSMAAAMARGWAATPGGPERMLFCDLDAGRAAALAGEVGGETRSSLVELAMGCDAIVLAVKPAALDDVAEELGGKAPSLVSVLAATPVAKLSAAFPGVPLVRVMPNQPVEVRRGVLCYVPPATLDEVTTRILALLGMLGRIVPLEEGLIEPAMAVMSCSPAYIALVAEALADAGAREGLAPGIAGELVVETIAGTAELLRQREPAEVRRRVAPPGGATEAGLEALERGGLAESFDAAVAASLERFR